MLEGYVVFLMMFKIWGYFCLKLLNTVFFKDTSKNILRRGNYLFFDSFLLETGESN